MRSLAGAGYRGRADRRPHHRRPPRQADLLAAGLALQGGTVAPPFVRPGVLPGPPAGRPTSDARALRLAAVGPYRRGDRQRHGCASDGVVRHVARVGTVRPVVVVHEALPSRGTRGARCSRSGTAAAALEDFLRIDKRFGPLTGSQWTALTVAAGLRRDLGVPRRVETTGADDTAATADPPARTQRHRHGLTRRRVAQRAITVSGLPTFDSWRAARPRRRPRAAPRRAGESGSAHDDRHAGVAALAQRRHQRHLREQGHAQGLGGLAGRRPRRRSARARRSAGRRTTTCSRSRRSGAGSCVRPSSRRARATLRAASCGVVTTSIEAPGRNEASEMLHVAGSRRQVAQQEVEIAPVHVAQELLDRLVQHRARARSPASPRARRSPSRSPSRRGPPAAGSCR